MKKFIAVLCAAILMASATQARPHGGWGFPRPPMHHHHRGNTAAGFVAGLVGGSILTAAAYQPRTVYTPVTYAPAIVNTPAVAVATPTVTVTAPAVVTTQAVVSAPVVTTVAQPCYTTSNIVTGATTTHCSGTIITQ